MSTLCAGVLSNSDPTPHPTHPSTHHHHHHHPPTQPPNPAPYPHCPQDGEGDTLYEGDYLPMNQVGGWGGG